MALGPESCTTTSQLKGFSKLRIVARINHYQLWDTALAILSLVHMSRLAKSLAQYFWPGALTIVSPCKDNNISRRVMAGGDNLAVRIPGKKLRRHYSGSAST